MNVQRTPSVSKVICVFASIAIGATILGLAFASATDTRPVYGSLACKAAQDAFWKSPISKEYSIQYIPQLQQLNEVCK